MVQGFVNNMTNDWFRSKIITGKKIGSTLGYPTLNLDNPAILKSHQRGVYACRVKIGNKTFGGALFFGPKLALGEKEDTLEIFVFDFHRQIYGQTVSFKLLDFIRPPLDFSDKEGLKKQIMEDCGKIQRILQSFPKQP